MEIDTCHFSKRCLLFTIIRQYRVAAAYTINVVAVNSLEMIVSEKFEKLKQENQRKIFNLRCEIKAWITSTLFDLDELDADERIDFSDYFSVQNVDGEKIFLILNKEGLQKVNVDFANAYDLGYFYKKERSISEVVDMLLSAKHEKELNVYLNNLGL